MKPTLYADDLGPDIMHLLRVAGLDIARALPRRCPGPPITMTVDGEIAHSNVCCDDPDGILYPDPPDWWYRDILQSISMPSTGQLQVNIRQEWEIFLHDVWRVLGIAEDTDE